MGRAIYGGEKVTSDNSARPGRHSLPLTSCCFSNADLVVVPPAGSQPANVSRGVGDALVWSLCHSAGHATSEAEVWTYRRCLSELMSIM